MQDVYASRTQGRPRLVDRMDPVVYPGGPGPLRPDQLASYEERGLLTRPSLFSPEEVGALNAALMEWAASEDVRRLDEAINEPRSGALRSVFRVHELHPLLDRLVRDERLLGSARQVLGGDVYVHQSRINFKPGFTGKEFYWHSDFETWHVEDGMPRMRALSVSLALTENNPFNGALMLIPKSHHVYVTCVGATPVDHYKQSLRRQDYGVPDPDSLHTLVARGGIEAPTGPPGTAVFFDCNTMHGSNSNISPYPRSNIFFVYNSVENRLRDPYCGLPPRPEYIATRQPVEPLQSA